MLIFTDPRAPATADIVAFHQDATVDHFEGTTGDIFGRVSAGTPGRTLTTPPLTPAPAPVWKPSRLIGER